MKNNKADNKEEEKKDLILIDGTNLFHRCHWAFSRLSNGEILTGGIYGFLNMLEYYSFRLNTEKMIILWDYESWRLQLFPDYKKSRRTKDKTGDSYLNFYTSFNKLKDIINSIGIPNFGIVGFEADDLLYFCSKKLKDYSIKIISGDKDMLQLVDDSKNIKQLKPTTGNTYTSYNEKQIEKEYQISKERFLDYMILVGDKVDDIPNIFGEKTALKKVQSTSNQKELIDGLDIVQKERFLLNQKLIDLKENENYTDKNELTKRIRKEISNKMKLFRDDSHNQETFDWLKIKKFIAKDFNKFKSKKLYLEIIKSF
jgi:DNA polymerase-1